LDGKQLPPSASAYQLRAQIASNLSKSREALAAVADQGPRRIYLGAASAVGGLGVLGGLLDAINTLEDKELEWIITSAAYAVIILFVTGFLLLRVMSFAADKDSASRNALDAQISALLDFTSQVTAHSANGTAESQPAAPSLAPPKATGQNTSPDPD
jgi:hypothetical protein